MNPNIARVDSRTRHPELYTAPDRLAAEDEVSALLAVLVYVLKPDFVLEVGTAYGHTAWHIAQALEANGVGHLDTIEMGPSRAEHARTVLAGLPATVHNTTYQEFTPPEGRTYQLAFFDAKWDERHLEFGKFASHLNTGSIVVFHDCGDASPGKAGVSILERQGLIKPALFLSCPRGVCLAQVL